MMRRFESQDEARYYISNLIDIPVINSSREIRKTKLNISCLKTDYNCFTNVYIASVGNDDLNPYICINREPTLINDVNYNEDKRIISSGGFFFLADEFIQKPKEAALNLAISDGGIRSMPVKDQETILVVNNGLRCKTIKSLGRLCIDGKIKSWSGSLTKYSTDWKLYSNGNAEVVHKFDSNTGKRRTLIDSSRFTPVINNDDSMVDLGLDIKDSNKYSVKTVNYSGKTNIFDHDLVIRGINNIPISDNSEVRFLDIDNIELKQIKSGISVGPMLGNDNFDSHEINFDKTLGSLPPFINRPLARIALFNTELSTNIILFDGRPGSEVFPGVTPKFASDYILRNYNVKWGCFLDPGQTARLKVIGDNECDLFGNRHYLKWPEKEGDGYAWIPDRGRPLASYIML